MLPFPVNNITPFSPLNLANLFAFYDFGNPQSLAYGYNVDIAATATGTSGTTALTMSSSVDGILSAGMLIRVGGSDVYTVSTVSGVNVTTTTNLTTNYSAAAVRKQTFSQVNDLSQNAYHATQSTAASQPTYIPTHKNGYGVADFDGTDDYFDLPAGFYNNIGTNGNFLLIVSISDVAIAANTAILAATLTTGSIFKYGLRYQTTGLGFRSNDTNAAAAIDTSITATNWNISYGRRSGTTQAVSVNNDTETTNANGSDITTISGASIGKFGTLSSQYLNGKIACIVALNTSPESSVIKQLIAWAASRYNITL